MVNGNVSTTSFRRKATGVVLLAARAIMVNPFSPSARAGNIRSLPFGAPTPNSKDVLRPRRGGFSSVWVFFASPLDEGRSLTDENSESTKASRNVLGIESKVNGAEHVLRPPANGRVAVRELPDATAGRRSKKALREQQLEAKYRTDTARLKLTLNTIREELGEMERRAEKFEASSTSLQKRLFIVLEEKRNEIWELTEEWTRKYNAKESAMQAAAELQNEWNDAELDRLQIEIDRLKDELRVVQGRATEFQEKSKRLQGRVALEVKSKMIALEKLETDLTNKFISETVMLKDEARMYADALEQLKVEAERQIQSVRTKSQNEKDAMELQILALQNNLGMTTRKLKNARSYHGTLRRKMNKLRQYTMFQLRKAKKKSDKELNDIRSEFTQKLKEAEREAQEEKETLSLERVELLEELDIEKGWTARLEEELEVVREDLTAELFQTKVDAARDLEQLRMKLTNELIATTAKAEWEKREIISERNRAVAERDGKIQFYEEERASIRKMCRTSLKLIYGRALQRYNKLEGQIIFLRPARMQVVNLRNRVRRAIKRRP